MRYFFILIPIGIFFLMHLFVGWRMSSLFEQAFRWRPLLLWFSAVLLNVVLVMTITMRGGWNPCIRIWRVATETYLGLLFILLSVLCAWGVIQWAAGFHRPIQAPVARWVVFVVTGIYMIAALANALTVRIRTVDLMSAKLTAPLTLVQISDLHLGPVYGARYVDRLVELANSVNPDLVLVTGDLLERGVQHEMLRGFNGLNAPGYFIWGNHDKFLPRREALDLLAVTPFTLLEDEVVQLDDRLQIIGLDYPGFGGERSQGDVLGRLPLRGDRFTLLLSHAPMEFPDWKRYPIDLQLAGHTHAGQIIPFNLVVRMRYRLLHGLYREGGKTAYVSPGTGTWGPPLRLGTRNEVTCIKLLPEGSE
jgi:predicted MPP superfamily phosphohydrolase